MKEKGVFIVCIAKAVRNLNDHLWMPDASEHPAPELLVSEPLTVDTFVALDGRAWVRVYLDGPTLDQNGVVRQRDLLGAHERRGDRLLHS